MDAGEKKRPSINNDGIALHLNGKDDLGLIQRAARKIDGMGIKHVALSGEGWNTDRAGPAIKRAERSASGRMAIP